MVWLRSVTDCVHVRLSEFPVNLDNRQPDFAPAGKKPIPHRIQTPTWHHRIYVAGVGKREISKLASLSVPDSMCRSCGAELPVASMCRVCGGLLFRGCVRRSTVPDSSHRCQVRP